MGTAAKVIETTGTIDSNHQLVLDEPLPAMEPTPVRVIILLPEKAEIEEVDWLMSAARNPAFNFLRESTEDVYTADDGRPFRDSEG